MSATNGSGASLGKLGLNRKILVADDYLLVRSNHKIFLEKLGFEVVEASNGQEAMDKLKESNPEAFSLIMVDLVMPVMNGAEFISASKEEYGERLPPVLVCSSVSEVPIIKQVASIGIDGYIIKPVDYKVLGKKLAEMLPSACR